MKSNAISITFQSEVLRAEGLQGPYYGLQPYRDLPQPPSFEVIDDLRRQFPSISALINASAPINRLPHEILLQIFFVLQVITGKNAPPAWTVVLLVCRRWFVVAATAPHFWRDLVVGKSLNLLRTGLIRSKGLSIGVSIIKRDALPETAQALLPQLSRLRSLFIKSVHQRHKEHVRSLMQRPMPLLEHFTAVVELPMTWTITDENPSLSIDRMPLTVDMFPKLQSLTVERITVPPTPDAVYQRLTALHIRDPEFQPYDTLVEVLRSCVNVQGLGLELDASGFNPDPIGLIHNTEKVVLPKLRTFRLYGWPWFLRDILHTIAIPTTLVDLSIQLCCPPYDRVAREQSISAILPGNYETELPIFSSVTEVHAQGRESEDVFTAYAPASDSSFARRRLFLRIPILHKMEPDLHSMFDEMGNVERPNVVTRSLRQLSIFSVSPVETLYIDIEASKVECVAWRGVFAHFPLLRELDITVQGGGALKPSAVLFAFAPVNPPRMARPHRWQYEPEANVTENVAPAIPPPSPPPFPHLRVLRLHRFRATVDEQEKWCPEPLQLKIDVDVSRPLITRRDAGCDALEELVLDLDCLNSDAWLLVDERRAACRSALADLVERLEYDERNCPEITYKDD